METFLSRVTKLTASMPDTALPVPVDTPRSITPNQAPSSENFALTAGSALAGWAMTGLKNKVLGSDSTPINGEIRPDSAPPSQSRFVAKSSLLDTSSGLKGLGSQDDVDPWKDEDFDDQNLKPSSSFRSRQKSAPNPHVASLGMKLPVKSKMSVVEKVVEEEQRKSLEDSMGAWPGMEDWEDDAKDDDGWGFDD